MTKTDAKKLADVRKLSKALRVLLWVGLFGMLMSLFEESVVWSIYCVLTGWIGIVIGLVGGAGWADYLLDQVPEHRRVSKTTVTVMSLFTYWIPTLAVLVFGLMLAGALREDLQPVSYIGGKSLGMIFESAAMYFTAAGASWAVVFREVKILQSKQAGPGNVDQEKGNTKET
jgi:hypothetical protein